MASIPQTIKIKGKGGSVFVNGVEYEKKRTCRFIPDVFYTLLEEDDNETVTEIPHQNCEAFECTNCGGLMMYGDMGWFDTEPPYKPRFDYCPYCGAKVVKND